MNNIGQRLYRLRQERGDSQDQMAAAAGVSLRTWAAIERGENVPSGDTLLRIATLGWSPGWILTGMGPERIELHGSVPSVDTHGEGDLVPAGDQVDGERESPSSGARGLSAEIRERLRIAVREAGGNRVVSERSGVPLSTIYSAVEGISDPRSTTLVAIVEATGRSIEWLFYGSDVAAGATEPFSPAEDEGSAASAEPEDARDLAHFWTPKVLERLRQAVKRVGGNRAASRVSKVALSTLNGALAGRTEPRASALAALAVGTGVSLDWILFGKEPAKAAAQPILTVPAGLGNGVDGRALVAVIELVEDWLSANGRTLSSAKKAATIAGLYQVAMEDAADGQAEVDARKVEQFLRLSATVLD